MSLTSVDLTTRLQVTRPVAADYEDINGVIQTASPNEPRFDYSNGVARGLLLDAGLNETGAFINVPAFNTSDGHWIINAELDNSEPLKGLGLNERFVGSGRMVVSYTGGVAKVWASGGVIHSVENYTPVEPTHVCQGGRAVIKRVSYERSAISDSAAAALATGEFEISRR